MSSRAHAAKILPPTSVDPIRVSEPSGARERRVEVVGSKEREDEELATTSRPAKEPAKPTLPMRLKSTRGRSARTADEEARIRTWRAEREKDLELRNKVVGGMTGRGHKRVYSSRGVDRAQSAQQSNAPVLKPQALVCTRRRRGGDEGRRWWSRSRRRRRREQGNNHFFSRVYSK